MKLSLRNHIATTNTYLVPIFRKIQRQSVKVISRERNVMRGKKGEKET